MYTQSMFWSKNNKKKNQFFSAENFQFLKLKKICLLHGQVLVRVYIKLAYHVVCDCETIWMKKIVLFHFFFYYLFSFAFILTICPRFRDKI